MSVDYLRVAFCNLRLTPGGVSRFKQNEVNFMKKVAAALLAVVMILCSLSIASYAADGGKCEVVFGEMDEFIKGYDLGKYRNDYVGKYMGYEYGKDYRYVIKNEDGSTTDVKTVPYAYECPVNKPLEFYVSVADYIEPSSVRMLAFPTNAVISDAFDTVTGEPNISYQIKKTSQDMFAVRPTAEDADKGITVCLSEYHLFNDCFEYSFPTSDYYKVQRVQDTTGGYIYIKDAQGNTTTTKIKPEDRFKPYDYGNKKVVYDNETLFFEVRIPLDNDKYEYHPDTYQVSYTRGKGDSQKTYNLKTSSQTEFTPLAEGADEKTGWVGRYIIDKTAPEDGIYPEQVDIFRIDNVDSTVKIKVRGTVKYTVDMLSELFKNSDSSAFDDFDWDSADLSPVVEFIARVIVLISKVIAGFIGV